MNDTNLAKLIRAKRRIYGWSQTDLSNKTGIAQVTISRIENEKTTTNNSWRTIHKITEALNLEIIIKDKDQDDLLLY